MAATAASTVVVAVGSGPQSPLNRNLERLFEDAHFTGELRVSSRRLREFPKLASKYNLNDTVFCDLSKNRLPELPPEVTRLTALEKLNLYHNVIRFIPDTVMYLQCLTYLDISRNQLSVIPAHLCKLPLQVLLVSHNRLISLPEEINQLTELIELDASCNQLSHLPIQLGDLHHLEVLNLRKNLLVELPRELMYLKLVTLDISLNRISVLPVELRFMVSLVNLHVEHNPLTTPPAHLCTRGRIHVFKYLEIEAIKEDRKRGILEGVDGKRLPRKPSTLPDGRLSANDPRRKRYTVDNSCNGFGTANGSLDDSMSRWTQSILHHANGHSNNADCSFASNIQQLKLNDDDDDAEDEQGCEERRRAARKILEQQMATQEEQRLPSHAQTYREYKESLRQQRANVYKPRDNGHTPSPDTPPMAAASVGAQPAFPKPSQPDVNHAPSEQSLSRPASLGFEQPSVKAVQKEAVMSYVKARTSPEVLSPLQYRGPVAMASPEVCTPPYRSPPVAPLKRPAFPPNAPTNGNRTPPPPPPSHTAVTASFTVRREMERQREEMEQIQQLRQCIETRLKVSLPDDLASALQDGVVLCHLANHVRPRSVASIHVPSPAVPKLTVAKCRRNVENFIEACRRIGVPENSLFTFDDIETLGGDRVRETLQCLLDIVDNAPVSPLTPPPTPAKRHDPKDVNENNEIIAPVKRVTFAIDQSPHKQEAIIDDVTNHEPMNEHVKQELDNVVKESSIEMNANIVHTARVTLAELIISHCAFLLVLLAAVAVNYFLS